MAEPQGTSLLQPQPCKGPCRAWQRRSPVHGSCAGPGPGRVCAAHAWPSWRRTLGSRSLRCRPCPPRLSACPPPRRRRRCRRAAQGPAASRRKVRGGWATVCTLPRLVCTQVFCITHKSSLQVPACPPACLPSPTRPPTLSASLSSRRVMVPLPSLSKCLNARSRFSCVGSSSSTSTSRRLL